MASPITEHPSTMFAGYVGATTPADSDNPNRAVAVGDLWADTTATATLKICTSIAPITFAQVGGVAHNLLSATHSDTTASSVARGDLITGQGASPKWDNLAKGTDGQKLASDGTDIAWEDDIGSIQFIIDGGGSAITTGVKAYIEVPFACTITQVTLLADQSGSIVVDIWKDTYANYPPVDADSITASAPPTISAATKSQDATLTGWTTTIAAGDILGFNVDSAATVTLVTLSLKVKKT